MPLTRSECVEAIAAMSPRQEMQFLATLGHWLTVAGRGTYEFQAPGVKDPVALRALNELHHRLYAQIRGLAEHGKGDFDAEDITSWLTGENQSAEFQAACFWSFEQALERLRNAGA
jgi:hypothetical protein